MNIYQMSAPPQWWSPSLRPGVVRLLRGYRRRKRSKMHGLTQVDVQGAEHVRNAVDAGCGVLIMPNHSSHADPFSMYDAADEVGRPFYFMAAWHVFSRYTRIGQQLLRWHGCFSVDREGTDMQAFRQAVKVVQQEPHPLVIFPEGEIYHCNDRVTPFREGPSVIALSAAKRAERDIVCVPCALKYEYVEDPLPELLKVMDELERQIFWRPKTDLSLPDRVYRFAEAILMLKEIEFLGAPGEGTLPQRIEALGNHVLAGLEERYGAEPGDHTIPERVKEVRRRARARLEEVQSDGDEAAQVQHDLDDVFLVVQLFSYPGDYVLERPTVERLAETLDKFEEDVLDVYSASIRGARKVTIRFDEPLPVSTGKGRKEAARELTDAVEKRVQTMLNEFSTAAGSADEESGKPTPLSAE